MAEMRMNYVRSIALRLSCEISGVPTNSKSRHKPVIIIVQSRSLEEAMYVGEVELVEVLYPLTHNVILNIERKMFDLVVHPCLRLRQPNRVAVN